MMVYSIKSTNVLYGITIFNCLYPLEAIFKSVLLWHNKPPKVFCLTFGVQFRRGGTHKVGGPFAISPSPRACLRGKAP